MDTYAVRQPSGDETPPRVLGGMRGTVPHRMLLSCPLHGAAALTCVSGGDGLLEGSCETWRIAGEGVVLVRSGETPALRVFGQPLHIVQLFLDGGLPQAEGDDVAVFSPRRSGGPAAAGLFENLLEHSVPGGGDALLPEFFAKLVEATQPLPPDGAHPPEFIHLLKQILNTRYAEKLTLDSLAGELHWNKYKLEKDFKRCCGCTPFEYLLNVRVEKACRLLRSTGQSVLEIGFAVGVENASYFIRMFKSRTGMSPLEYRIRCAKDANQDSAGKSTKA